MVLYRKRNTDVHIEVTVAWALLHLRPVLFTWAPSKMQTSDTSLLSCTCRPTRLWPIGGPSRWPTRSTDRPQLQTCPPSFPGSPLYHQEFDLQTDKAERFDRCFSQGRVSDLLAPNGEEGHCNAGRDSELVELLFMTTQMKKPVVTWATWWRSG